MPIKKTLSSVGVLTHPDKILYPEDKITKLQLAEYYAAISKWMLPYIINRPLTLVRCPESYKSCFYQKHISNTQPHDIYNILIQEKTGKDNYIYIKDQAGLLALPQMGVLEIHPWGSNNKNIELPDMIIFDFDPAPDVSWKKVVTAAFAAKEYLDKLKLKSFVRTTGGKGLHVVIPIKPKYDWDTIKQFSRAFVDYLVEQHPTEYVANMNKAKRKGKIFVDYLRNQRGATAVASYSTRARLHAPIATPIDWSELTNNQRDTSYTLKTIMTRMNSLKKDPWHNFFKLQQILKLDK